MGRIRIQEQTAPSTPPSGYIELYVDSADGNLKQKDDTGTVVDLTTAGSGESNTASNVGVGGVGIFKQKTSVDLEFKNLNAGSGKITITDDTGNDEIDIDVDETAVDHDNLLNYSANEHIDHTSVTFSAGTGLSGGGTIAANRSFALDISGITTETSIDNADLVVFYDDSAGAHKVITFQNFSSGLGGGGTVQSASNVGVDGVGVFKQLSGTDLEFKNVAPGSTKVTVTANGDDIDIDIAEANIDHDSLLNFVANEHIDWTSTSENLTTTGTVDAGKVLVGPSGSGTEELQVVSTGTRNGLQITTSGTGVGINITHSSSGNLITAGTELAVDSTGEISSGSLTASRALVSGSSKEIQSSSVTSTELGHLSGVTSAIQTQLDAKLTDSRTIATAADSGLTGGGDLSADRSLSVDIPNTTELTATPADDDELIIYDTSAGANRSVKYNRIPRTNFGGALENVGVSCSYDGSGNLDITLHGDDGTALSSTNVARIGFRSQNIQEGTYELVELTSNLTITIPNGATLGTIGGGASERINIFVIRKSTNNALAVTKAPIKWEDELASTSVISTSASNPFGFYSSVSATDAAVRWIGYIEVSETTAGNWSVDPDRVSINTLGNTWAFSVGFKYYEVSATQSIPNNTLTAVNYENSGIGPAFSTSTTPNWRVQAAKPGYMTYTAKAMFASTTWVTGTQAYLHLYVNGVYRDTIAEMIIQNGYTGKLLLSGAGSVRMEVDDYAEVFIFHDNGGAINISATPGERNFYIFRGYGIDV